jgi:DUF4097 and DUF4098 domain-containing protein YvlB
MHGSRFGFRFVRWVAICATTLLAAAGPAVGQSTVEKEFTLAAGDALVLAAERGSVQVTGGPGSKARVVVSVASGDVASRVDLQFAHHDGLLEITAKKRGGDGLAGWLGLGGGGGLRFAVEVPEATPVTVSTAGGSIDLSGTRGDAALDTSGGSIRVSRVAGTVSADTSGGGITAEEIDGDVTADTSGGSIHLEDVTGNASADTSGGSIHAGGIRGHLKADTSGGSIRILDAGGRVDAETAGGSIDASWAVGNAAGGALDASGGGIRVAVDPSVDLVIDAEASGGSVTADLPFAGEVQAGKRSLRGTLGRGGARLELRSSGGPIRIEGR